MTLVLAPSLLWVVGVVLALLSAVALVLFRRRRKTARMKFHSSLPAEAMSSNDISKNNLELSEITSTAVLERASLFCDIVQKEGKTFRVLKAKLDRYDVPVGANQVATFVALKERDPFEEKVWYLVEERGTSLHVLGLASETHTGLIHAFEIIGRAGKQPSAALNPADQALLNNFGWNVQDVQLFTLQDRKDD